MSHLHEHMLSRKEKRARELVPYFFSRHLPTRIHAIEEAAELANPASVPYLVKLLHDDSSLVRVASIRALAKINTHSSHDALLYALGSRRPRVRAAAVEEVGRLKLHRALPFLLVIIEKENLPYIKCVAIDSASRLSGDGHIRPLVKALHSKGHATRVAAVIALGRIGGREVSEALKRCLKDSNHDVRREAANVLRSIKA